MRRPTRTLTTSSRDESQSGAAAASGGAAAARDSVGSILRLVEQAVELVLPRRCVQCGAPGSWLCATCRDLLEPLDGPRCFRCGRPLSAPALHCLECEGRRLGFVTAAAAFAYDGPAKRLVTTCKFRALRSVAVEMADLAAPRFVQVVGAGGTQRPVDVVTWVPTTRQRRVERGFDQAEVFARRLAEHAGLPARALLVRRGGAARQHSLGRAAREQNVRDAFHWDPQAAAQVQQVIQRPLKRVIICDDVYTTGETLNQCALASGGAGYDVHVFTFARTVRGHRW